MEHSGTTFLARNINRLKGVRNGFECGVLLAPSPRRFHRFQPYYGWMSTPVEKGHWGLSRKDLEFCCDTDSFDEFYRRVHRLSPACRGTRMIDKTPGYVFHLDQVMHRVDVPVLITDKDIRLMYRSYSRRSRLPLWPLRLLAFLRRQMLYRRNLLRWFGDPRLLIVRHDRLAREPEVVLREVCALLGVAFNPDESMDMGNRPIRADYDIERELVEARTELNWIERLVLGWVESRCQVPGVRFKKNQTDQ